MNLKKSRKVNRIIKTIISLIIILGIEITINKLIFSNSASKSQTGNSTRLSNNLTKEDPNNIDLTLTNELNSWLEEKGFTATNITSRNDELLSNCKDILMNNGEVESWILDGWTEKYESGSENKFKYISHKISEKTFDRNILDKSGINLLSISQLIKDTGNYISEFDNTSIRYCYAKYDGDSLIIKMIGMRVM